MYSTNRRGVQLALKLLSGFAILISIAALAMGQTVSLHGQVVDESGAVVPKATVVLRGPAGQTKTATSSNDGSYSFRGLEPGQYTVEASAPKLESQPVQITLKQGPQTLRLELKIAATQQQVTVQDNSGTTLSTESANNVSALVLKGKDLETLADDPEDLATDLQALAGPAAGPGGDSIYIDGFSGGQLPPKDAIREIHINQNPFAPEYDKIGYGRVEILTKPGANKFHGNGYYNFGDSVWNSRNPYAAEKAPFLLKEYGGSLEGPFSKSASFFLTVDRAAIDNGAIINGAIVDPNTFSIINPYTQVFRIPQRRIRISPRVDYQLAANDTLSLRYQFSDADIQHSGVGGFNLVSTGIHNHGTDQTIQLSNALILGANALNETRFQFYRANISSVSDNFGPQLDVLNAFIGGGAQVGSSLNTLNTYELQNHVTITRTKHTARLGVRARAATIDNNSPISFGGTYTFAGGTAPELDANNQPVLNASGQPVLETISSIESYRRSLLFESMGFSASQIRALGGGASQFTINSGNPFLSVNQEDIGAFVGDHWLASPNLTVDLGLRYEWQTNLHDWRDFGPRVGFAWAPPFGKSGASPKTVIRGGFGMFYQRLDIVNVLNAERYNGLVQQQYVVTNPDFFPLIPPISTVSRFRSQQTTEELSPNLRAPYLMQSAIAIERQLPAQTTVALTYVNSHGVHQFLTNDINAPLPGTYNPQVPGSGTYPLGHSDAVFLVESAVLYNQN